MAKKLTRAKILEAAVHAGVVPGNVEMLSRDVWRWREGELLYQLLIEPKRGDAFGWALTVGDGKFGPALKDYGHMSILVRLIGNPSIPWPTVADEKFASFFFDRVREARTFVTDRGDLARILASDEDVCRGSLYAWLPSANYIGRLIRSVVIARDVGDEALVGEVLRKLHSGVRVPSYDRDVDILIKAKELAMPLSKALGFNVEL